MDGSLRMKEPIAPQLFDLLLQSIVDLRLRPGEALSEKDIAGRFGVSRQPVREAFIKLSEIGLVEIRPSRGTYVTKISVRDVANARFVREAIESDIAASAARLASPADLQILALRIAEQKAAADANDLHGFYDRDEAFHRAIAEIVDCEFAWRTVETARFQTDRVRFLSLPTASPLRRLIGQHEALAAAIGAGDAGEASSLMRRHLREILLALPRIAAANPEYFSEMTLPGHTLELVPADGS